MDSTRQHKGEDAMQLVLIRHGESEWNRLNLFTGWNDIGLSEKGVKEAMQCGRLLRESEFDFDVSYTSYLKRAIRTLNIILEQMDREWLPVIKTWKLNERHYGALQGLNKAETAAKYGERQIAIWRRSYAVAPPALEVDDERNPRLKAQYREVDKNLLPLTESLKDTIARVLPYYKDVIKQNILAGRRVCICAHGNTLRGLVKYLDNISDDDITVVEIPTGVPLVYELDSQGNALDKRYLGSQISEG